MWIPLHAKIEVNEIANQLAKLETCVESVRISGPISRKCAILAISKIKIKVTRIIKNYVNNLWSSF